MNLKCKTKFNFGEGVESLDGERKGIIIGVSVNFYGKNAPGSFPDFIITYVVDSGYTIPESFARKI